MGRFVEQHEGEDEPHRINEQNSLIERGDILALAVYLEPLIGDMLDHYEVHDHSRRQLLKQDLIDLVLHAAEVYKSQGRHRESEYQFATYYTWFAKDFLDENAGSGRVENQ